MELNELNDFKEIEEGGRLKDDLNLSNIYNVKVGGFGDIEIVKTYLTSLTIDELEQDISVYETLSKDKSWPVSQIIQREVDKIRVSNISKDYVLRKERVVKYFPPIIIAILPKNPDETFSLKLDYEKKDPERLKEYIYEKSNYRRNEKLKDYFLSANDVSLVNGFYLLQVSKVFDFNILCWDKSKYYAVVIDGQHRLDSLVKSKKDNPSLKSYYQDVVFIDFTNLIKRLGDAVTPVEVVRRVFVDINTNAKRVGTVRQILMDDKDLASLLVQSLVDSVDREGADKPANKFLKSQLVDWYGESLKHNLPHITGILALQQILSDYLLDGSLSSIDNLRSPNKVKKWVNTLNSYFFVDKKIVPDSPYSSVTKLLDSLKEYNVNRSLDEEIYEEESEFKETTLFVYDFRVLEVAQDTFEEMYASSIVQFFNDFEPYKKAYEIVDQNKGFDHTSIVCKALLSSRKNIASSKTLKDSIAKLKVEMEESLNEKFFLLFSVLGHKTLFNLFFKRIFQNFTPSYNEESIKRVVQLFLEDINTLVTKEKTAGGYIFGKKENFILNNLERGLVDLGAIASHFWEGIIYENNRIIYNSQGIKSFSSAIEYMINLNNSIKSNEELPEFKILFMESRIKRILKKTFDYSEDEISTYTAKIIGKKEEFIVSMFKTGA